MRSIWSGSISFGLVNIPVKLYSASQERAISFDYLHKEDQSKIKYVKVCASENKEVPFEEVVKGFEISKGNYVIIDENDFEKSDPKKTRSIEIIQFSSEDEIPEILLEKPYFLEPEENADKPFLLFRQALDLSKRVAIAKFVLRNKEHLAILKPYENLLLLNQLRFSDEIRNAEDLRQPKAEVTKDELKIANSLIDNLSKKFDIKQFHDTFTEQMIKIIEAKAEGKEIVQSKAPEATDVEDLMELLRQSLDETKKEDVSRKVPKKEKVQ